VVLWFVVVVVVVVTVTTIISKKVLKDGSFGTGIIIIVFILIGHAVVSFNR
jgi:ABC-type polysaccharide/polyol phosphate export permease